MQLVNKHLSKKKLQYPRVTSIKPGIIKNTHDRTTNTVMTIDVVQPKMSLLI